MQLKEVEELKRKLREQYEADLAAIDRVAALIRQGKPTINIGGAIATGEVAVKTIESCVTNAINRLGKPFTLGDVMAQLHTDFPKTDFNRATVAAMLYRRKGKDLRVKVEGKGRRAAVYEKTS